MALFLDFGVADIPRERYATVDNRNDWPNILHASSLVSTRRGFSDFAASAASCFL